MTSQLLQHPDVNVLFPDYAGELTYVLAGIQAAHRTGVKTYLAFGGGTPFVQLQTAQPGATIIQSDVSESPPWTGYLLVLQAIRGLAERNQRLRLRSGRQPSDIGGVEVTEPRTDHRQRVHHRCGVVGLGSHGRSPPRALEPVPGNAAADRC